MSYDDDFINEHIAICLDPKLSDFSFLGKLDIGIRRRTLRDAWDIYSSEDPYLQAVALCYKDWIGQFNNDEYTARYLRRVALAWKDHKEPPKYPGPEFQEPIPDDDDPHIEGMVVTHPMDLAAKKAAVIFRGPNYEKSTDAIKKDLRRKATKMGLKIVIWAVPDEDGIVFYCYQDKDS